MSPTLLVIAYGITIIASAMAGGYLPRIIRMNHVRMQVVLSFVGGLMLGVAVLILLPHGFLEIHRSYQTEASPEQISGGTAVVAASPLALPTAAIRTTSAAVLAGLLLTFFMMRAFHFHQHGEEDEDGHDHAPEKAHDHAHDPAQRPRSKLGWIGVIFGLGLHTFMDGVALGAAVLHDWGHSPMAIAPAGFGVYLAILLHKPLDALSVSTLMATENRSWRSIQTANACFGLMCLVGALCALHWPALSQGKIWLGLLLAASSGVFLCISLSDLLPEVQFHRHDRLQLSAALLAGIGISFAIEFFHQH